MLSPFLPLPSLSLDPPYSFLHSMHRLGSFQIQERVLTNKALIQRVVNHYEQQVILEMRAFFLS